MIRVTSLLWIWQGESAGRWYFLTIPEEQSDEIRATAIGSTRGFGSARVEASVRGVTWRTSVFPLNSGGYLLPVKAEVRKRAEVTAGDEVTVDLDLI
jgi:Domain of unknown function (DUF1905).